MPKTHRRQVRQPERINDQASSRPDRGVQSRGGEGADRMTLEAGYLYVHVERYPTHAVICYRPVGDRGHGGIEVDYGGEPWLDSVLQAAACTKLSLARGLTRFVPVIYPEEIEERQTELRAAGVLEPQ